MTHDGDDWWRLPEMEEQLLPEEEEAKEEAENAENPENAFRNLEEAWFCRENDSDFVVSSLAEVDRAGAYLHGSTRQDQAWVLSSRDVWYPNPYYVGPPQRHPEDYDEYDLSEREFEEELKRLGVSEEQKKEEWAYWRKRNPERNHEEEAFALWIEAEAAKGVLRPYSA